MPAPVPTIRRATQDETDTVAAVLAEAFLNGDLGPWLVPHVDARFRVYGPYFRIFAEHAQVAGWIDVTDDLAAAAIWYRVDETLELGIPSYDTRLAQACGEHLHRFVALDRAMEAHHPTGSPHHYLAFLGVRPDQQNQGLGSALLHHHHRQLDATGVSAYLEATGHRNGALYRRHGYVPRQRYKVANGPSLYPMWRPTGGGAMRSGTTAEILHPKVKVPDGSQVHRRSRTRAEYDGQPE